MKYFKILILSLLICFTSINSVVTGETFKSTGLNICGKALPLALSDCTKYNTGTGFTCCIVTNISNESNVCILVSNTNRAAITPPFYTGPGKVDCGLNGSYIKFSMLIFISALLFLLF